MVSSILQARPTTLPEGRKADYSTTATLSRAIQGPLASFYPRGLSLSIFQSGPEVLGWQGRPELAAYEAISFQYAAAGQYRVYSFMVSALAASAFF